jgi:hypothetical protein
MREIEQVEWLIEQILARSNTNRASKVRELTPLPKVPPRQRGNLKEGMCKYTLIAQLV